MARVLQLLKLKPAWASCHDQVRGTKMPKLIRSLFPAALIAALCLPVVAFAQTEPGSLNDLLDADFAPLQTQTAQPSPELNAPLILGPQVQRPQQAGRSMDSVLEIPRVAADEPAPGELLLPDLTIPTPQNTASDSFENRRSLKPQLEVRPPDPIELLPFDDGDVSDLRTKPRAIRPQPRIQTPQALNYGSQAWSSRSRIQVAPIQVEFFSVNRGFGYQPYGGYGGYSGYRRPPVSYRPYGGYVPYGGYGGRYCPSGR